VEGTLDDVLLLFASQFDEVHCITGNPERKLRILLRVIHCVEQGLPVKNVHIDVVAVFGKVAIQQAAKVADTIIGGTTQSAGNDREGIGNAILALAVGQFRVHPVWGRSFCHTPHWK
jgi:hypothetical protein